MGQARRPGSLQQSGDIDALLLPLLVSHQSEGREPNLDDHTLALTKGNEENKDVFVHTNKDVFVLTSSGSRLT